MGVPCLSCATTLTSTSLVVVRKTGGGSCAAAVSESSKNAALFIPQRLPRVDPAGTAGREPNRRERDRVSRVHDEQQAFQKMRERPRRYQAQCHTRHR